MATNLPDGRQVTRIYTKASPKYRVLRHWSETSSRNDGLRNNEISQSWIRSYRFPHFFEMTLRREDDSRWRHYEGWSHSFTSFRILHEIMVVVWKMKGRMRNLILSIPIYNNEISQSWVRSYRFPTSSKWRGNGLRAALLTIRLTQQSSTLYSRFMYALSMLYLCSIHGVKRAYFSIILIIQRTICREKTQVCLHGMYCGHFLLYREMRWWCCLLHL